MSGRARGTSSRRFDRTADAQRDERNDLNTASTSAGRVAVLSDVHGNAIALQAVLDDLRSEPVHLFVFGGDLTWGSLPEETRELVAPLEDSAIFIRGNAERALAEAHARARGDAVEGLSARERWMVERHTPATRAFLAGFVESAVVDIRGLGATRFCHGSLRSDEELITFATPERRMAALLDGIDERVLVSAHTHIRFDRDVAGVRSVNPGSVGMPYEGRVGVAFWALIGPDVDLRETAYDVEEAIRSYRATDDPSADAMADLLLNPPTPSEVVADAEAREFAG